MIRSDDAQYLAAAGLRFLAAEGGGRPHVQIEGRMCLLNARLRRCFPLTGPETHIALFDSGGTEIGVIADIRELDASSREVAAAELDSFYFTPAISKIKWLKQEASMWKWDVETQRGDVTFYLRGVRDSVHEVAPDRWQVFSVDGQRYEIKELSALDQRSQNLFESLF